MKEGSVPEGIWPQSKVDCSWPSGASVEKLLACTVGKVTNGTLRDPILEMCIDAAEGKSLLGHLACCLEIVVCEMAIVAMIMLNANTVLLGKTLEEALGVDGLLGCE